MSKPEWRVVGTEPCQDCGGSRDRQQLVLVTQGGEVPCGEGVLDECVCRAEVRRAQEREAADRERARRAAEALFRAKSLSETSEWVDNRTFATYIEAPGNKAALDLAQRQARRMIARAEKHDGIPRGIQGVGLYGAVACGKTHLACAVLNECIRAGIPGIFATTASIVANLMSDPRGERRTAYGRTPLLIADDLAAEPTSKLGLSKLRDIFNTRREERLPVIVTTNKTPTQLVQHYTALGGDDIAPIMARLEELTVWPWTAVTERVQRGAA
jgi:DNA replication protein DnaC